MRALRGKLYACTDKSLPDAAEAASGAQVFQLVMAKCKGDFERHFNWC